MSDQYDFSEASNPFESAVNPFESEASDPDTTGGLSLSQSPTIKDLLKAGADDLMATKKRERALDIADRIVEPGSIDNRSGGILGYSPRDITDQARSLSEEGRLGLKQELQDNLELGKEYQASADAVGYSPVTQQFLNDDSENSAWTDFWADPITIVKEIGLRSAPQSALSAVGAITAGIGTGGNPLAVGAGSGAVSARLEYGNSIIEGLRKEGVDIESADSIIAAKRNPELMDRVETYARKRAEVIGGFDAISGGLASKDMGIGSGAIKRNATNLINQGAVQAGMGMAGEAGAQLRTEGEIASTREILAEGVGELVTAPLDVGAAVGSTVIEKRREAKAKKESVEKEEQAKTNAELDELEQDVTELHSAVVDHEFEKANNPFALEDNSSDFVVSTEGEAKRKQGSHKLTDRVSRMVEGKREREANAHLKPAEVNSGPRNYQGPRYEYFDDTDDQGNAIVSILDKETGAVNPISVTEQGQSAQELNDKYVAQIKAHMDKPAPDVPKYPERTEPFKAPVTPKPSAQEIEVAAAETNTAPSEAQIEADNYKKGRIKFGSLNIAIENPKGSVRSGTDEQGNKWESKMVHHYGDIKGTKGADGDDLDVFIGDSTESEKVFVVDQVDTKTGKFDEHKVLVGFNSLEEAKAGYLANYEENWQGLGEISEAHEHDFNQWLKEGDTTKPYRLADSKADQVNDIEADQFQDQEKEDISEAYQQYEQQNPTELTQEKPTDNNPSILADQAEGSVSPETVSAPAEAKESQSVADLFVSANKKPFVSEKAAKASIATKIRSGKLDGVKEDYEVVPTGNGFGYRAIESAVKGDEDQTDPVDHEQGDQSEIVVHQTRRGKEIRGVVRTDISHAEAKAIDEYTFKKDGGYFIREKYVGESEAETEQLKNAGKASKSKPVKFDLKNPRTTLGSAYDFVERLEGEDATQAQQAFNAWSGSQDVLDDAISDHKYWKKRYDDAVEFSEERGLDYVDRPTTEAFNKRQSELEEAQANNDRLKAEFKSIHDRIVSGSKPASEIDSDSGRDTLDSEQAQNKDLSTVLLHKIDLLTDNHKLKAAVAEYNGVSVKEVKPEQMKEAQEALEFALVQKAREVVIVESDQKATYDKLVDLYQSQPNLNVRSSTSMKNMAYSTPAPLAYLGSKLAGINDKSFVYEPTAGNGMLLIGANPDLVIANELNDLRVSQLKEQGFQVTQEDATTFQPGTMVDAVIMNPPFGRLRDEDGKAKPVKIDGYTIKSVDHLIAAQALKALKDDGRSVIIIGAQKKAGDIGPSDRTFFNWLYSNYNVVDHFEVDGDLYKRQGAGWPVRLLVVNGREESNNISPVSGSIERVRTWDEVYERFTESMDSISERDVTTSSESANGPSEPITGHDSPSSSVETDREAGAPSERSGSKRGGSERATSNSSRSSARQPTSERTKTDSASADSKRQPKRSDLSSRDQQGDIQSSRDGSADERTDIAKPARRSQPRKQRVKDNAGSAFQSNYNTRSTGSNDAVLTPVNMAGATDRALADLESEVGSIDQFVMDELGYKSLDDLHKSFMGLQVDTIAAGIHNMNNGKGIIIADQTGVGKGRQAAGLLRYALRQGKVPVFVSVKDNLFTDMYNDLADIGTEDVRPLIMNQDGVIKQGSQTLFKNPSRAKQLSRFQDIIDNRALPDDSNMLFLTYSQLNTANKQREVIDAIKDNAVFVLDESHNAAGEREKITKKGKQTTTAGFVYQAIQDRPVIYLSATYAKRPDNMPVYYRTDLMDAVDNVDELVDAVAAGGAPLQTVMSGMLAESGQLFRRERSFDGIEVKTVIDTDNTSEHTKIADAVTEGLRAITAADSMFHNVFVEQYADRIQQIGGDAFGAGNRAEASVDHTNFSSIVHNFISQLLLGLKAKKAAEMAIDTHKKGIKPVLALENTMGSFLSSYVEETGAVTGDVVDADYRDVLMRALDRTRRISVKTPQGDQSAIDIPLSELDPVTRKKYNEATRIIEKLDIGELPVSPIDYVRSELEKAGISVAEITGRSYKLDYSDGDPVLSKRSQAEIKDRRGTVDSFNNGELDALVLNAAGSTGLSIHASEKFKDQSPRHMIVMQAMADINILMQMLGRINRTGQVHKPSFSMMGLNIPAEKRPLARTASKMKSLNANTSANTDSDTSVDAPDIMNKYGDRVVAAYLAENSDVARSVNMSGYGAEESTAMPGTALKFTGRLALLPVKRQVEIYEDIEASYNNLIDYLNKTNQNDLVPSIIDLDARVLDSKVAYEGKAPDTLFGGHTVLHKVDAKYQGKPPTPEDVEAALDKALKKQSAQEITDAIYTAKSVDAKYEQSLESRIDRFKADLDRVTAKGNDEKTAEAQSQLEAAEKALKDYQTIREQSQRMAEVFQVGNRVRLDLGDEKVTGVVVSVKDSHRKGKGNPYALSKTRIGFMVNSGIRQIEMPFSQLKADAGIFIERLQTKGKEGLSDIFAADVEGFDRREERYVATGNLIAGSAKLRGRIVTFSDNQGDTHQGILMPRGYNENNEYESLGSSDSFALRDNDTLIKFLRDNRDDDALRKYGVMNSGKQIKLRAGGNKEWEIQIPKANKDAIVRRVKFDEALKDAMGTEFYGSSSTMSARFPDSALPKVIPVLNDLALMQALPSMREQWVAAGGSDKPKVNKSFTGEKAESDKEAKPTNKSAFFSDDKPATSGISAKAIERVVSRITKGWKNLPDVSVVARVSDLPASILKEVEARKPKNLQGVRAPDGRVFLIAENIRGTAHAEKVLAHEVVGHWAVEEIQGHEFQQVLDQVKELKRKGDKVILKYAAKVNGEGDPNLEAQEIIAKMAEDVVTHPVMTRVLNWIRSVLAKLGFKVSFGVNSDLMQMIQEALRFAKEGDPIDGDYAPHGEFAFSQEKRDEGVIFGENTKAGAGYAALKSTTEAVQKSIKKAWSKNWTADMRPGWLALLTRRHMSDIAGKALPQIRQYVKLAQEMDARRNELLSGNAKLAERWTKFNLKDRAEAKRLAQLMHDATLAGVDPSKDYQPVMTVEKLDEIRAKNKVLIKDRSRDGAGGRTKGVRSADQLRDEIKQAEIKMAQERNRAKAKDRLAGQWDSLSPEAQSIFRDVRDSYKNQQQMTMDALEARIGRSFEDGKQAKALLDSLREQFESVQVEEPYFPLARFGKYWVSAKRGEQHIFEMFETTQEQESHMEKMKKQGYSVRHGASLDSLKELDGVSAKFVNDVETLLEEKLGTISAVDGIKDEIYQMYLQSLPDLSTRKHFIHRKKVEGFAKDALRAFADNTFHGSYQLARLEYSDLLSAQLDEMREGLESNPDQLKQDIKIHEQAQNYQGLEERSLRELHGKYVRDLEKDADDANADMHLKAVKLAFKYQENSSKQYSAYERYKRALNAYKQIGGDRVKAAHLYNEMLKRHDWAMNPKGAAWANKVSSIGFTWYLGVSPAAAFVNITQTAMVAYPILAAKFGWKEAGAALMNTNNNYFAGGFGVEKALTGDRLKAYNEAVRTGVIDKTLAHDLAGLAQEGQAYSPTGNWVMEKVAFLFHNAERYNREVTYMAAYDLARGKGQTHKQAIDYAHDLTWESHFDYSSGNKARFMQNDFAKVALMFRQFSLNMTYLLARNAYNSFKGETPEVKQQARKQITGILGMHFLFAGAMGLPLFSVLGKVLEAVFDDEDEPWKFEPEFRNFLADYFGKDVGRILARGIANETGFNIASRVSLDGLWLRESNKELEGRDQVAYWMEQLLGPMGAIAFGMGTAADLASEGHTWRAVESTVPKFVKDGMRAYRYLDDGAQTLRGDPLVDEFGPLVLIAQALGFSPAELQDRYEANGAIKGYERRIKDRRTNLINRFALAYRLSDKDEMQHIKKAIIEFNKANPAVRITRGTLVKSYRRRARYSHDQINGITVDKKLRYLTENGRFAE